MAAASMWSMTRWAATASMQPALDQLGRTAHRGRLRRRQGAADPREHPVGEEPLGRMASTGAPIAARCRRCWRQPSPQMFGWWQAGKLKPRISGRYDLAEARTALSPGGRAQGHRQDRADACCTAIMSDPVAGQYEAYPYPARNPQDEKTRLVDGSPSNLKEVDHYVFGGARDFRLPLRALVAGGGTGDATDPAGPEPRRSPLPGGGRLSRSFRGLAAYRRSPRQGPRSDQHPVPHAVRCSICRGSASARFDYIDCCGVLHHLEGSRCRARRPRRRRWRPMAAWG